MMGVWKFLAKAEHAVLQLKLSGAKRVNKITG